MKKACDTCKASLEKKDLSIVNTFSPLHSALHSGWRGWQNPFGHTDTALDFFFYIFWV